MSSVTLHDVRFIEPEKTRNYLNIDYGAFSWLLTKDHKRIAILYLFSVTLFFMVGGFFATMDDDSPHRALRDRRVASSNVAGTH